MKQIILKHFYGLRHFNFFRKVSRIHPLAVRLSQGYLANNLAKKYTSELNFTWRTPTVISRIKMRFGEQGENILTLPWDAYHDGTNSIQKMILKVKKRTYGLKFCKKLLFLTLNTMYQFWDPLINWIVQPDKERIIVVSSAWWILTYLIIFNCVQSKFLRKPQFSRNISLSPILIVFNR